LRRIANVGKEEEKKRGAGGAARRGAGRNHKGDQERHRDSGVYTHGGDDRRQLIVRRYDQIEKWLKEKLEEGKVYLHCHKGVSRSVSIALCLAQDEGKHYKQVLQYLGSSGGAMKETNSGFMMRLKERHDQLINHNGDWPSSSFRTHSLWNPKTTLRKMWMESEDGGESEEDKGLSRASTASSPASSSRVPVAAAVPVFTPAPPVKAGEEFMKPFRKRKAAKKRDALKRVHGNLSSDLALQEERSRKKEEERQRERKRQLVAEARAKQEVRMAEQRGRDERC